MNKPKMVRFLKFKFLIILKLNFNGGQFFKNKPKNDLIFRIQVSNYIKIKFQWGVN